MSQKHTHFSSRLGFILSMMGIAVGAGNIWRFPRIAAQNGCGAFILLWLCFLFLWSIPLIIIELSIGKLTQKAPIGAIIKTAGKKIFLGRRVYYSSHDLYIGLLFSNCWLGN